LEAVSASERAERDGATHPKIVGLSNCDFSKSKKGRVGEEERKRGKK
jgi:hypothetical protein